MAKQIRLSLAALTVIVAGSAYLAVPAHAERFAACDLWTMIDVSDQVCGGGSFIISDIEDSGGTCSWSLTCY